MEFKEVYCANCKKTLGRYNIKFYDDDKISELFKTTHSVHVRQGHEVIIKKIKLVFYKFFNIYLMSFSYM